MNGLPEPALEALAGIEVELGARIGQARLSLAETAALRVGSTVRLDCHADAPVVLLANGVPIARGDLVVMEDDELAVEIAEVGS